MRQRERVAELRRHLPTGAPIQDYAFEEGPRDLNAGDAPVRTVRLSELFTKPNRSLVIYHLMYGKRQTKACPMCTAWLDGANGVAHHLAQNLDFAVVAAADVPTLRAHARTRGWDRLRLLSGGDSTFKYDLGSEDREGHQDSTVSVFTRDADGTRSEEHTSELQSLTNLVCRLLLEKKKKTKKKNVARQGRQETKGKRNELKTQTTFQLSANMHKTDCTTTQARH